MSVLSVPARGLAYRFWLAFGLSVLVLCLATSMPALAQEPPSLDDIDRDATKLSTDIEGVSQELNKSEAEQSALSEIRTRIADLEGRLAKLNEALAPIRERVNQAKQAVGPEPAEGATPEPDEVIAERKRVTERVTRVEGLQRRLELSRNQIDLLLVQLAGQSRSQFLTHVFDRGPFPLLPSVWAEALESLVDGYERLEAAFTKWRADQESKGRLRTAYAVLIVSFILVLILGWPVRRWTGQRFLTMAETDSRDRSWLFGTALMRFGNRVLWIGIALAILYGAAFSQGLVTPENQMFIAAVGQAVAVTFVGFGLAKSVFSPLLALARPIGLTDRQARAAFFALTTALMLVAIDLVVRRAASVLASGVSLAVVQSFVVAVLLSLALLPLASRQVWARPKVSKYTDPADGKTTDKTEQKVTEDPAVPVSASLAMMIRWCAIGLIVTTVGAAFLGYTALARFIVEKAVNITALLLLVFLVRGYIKALANRWVAWSLEQRSAQRSGEGSDDEPESFLGFWVGITVDSILILAFIPLALLVAGVPWIEIRNAYQPVMDGINVGPIRVSIGDMLLAILLFVGGLFVTRLVQRTLDKTILPKTNLNFGVRNSLTTLFGYAATLIVVLIAVSVAGVDLSNLALIAGALSVGIGFGLQSVVSNFVSGLILLFERPVKVGDWIVTPSGQGIVKQISIRSTEIESFDRQALIVPNAEMISSTITNWSHRDKIGRLIIKVGVSYSSDPRQVEKILLECARENPLLTRWPEAFVYFSDFGDSALILELRAYVRNTDSMLGAQSQLRFAIVEKFRAAGIEIPFPQQDIYVKAMPKTQPPMRAEPVDTGHAEPATPKPTAGAPKGPEVNEDDEVNENDTGDTAEGPAQDGGRTDTAVSWNVA